MNDLTVGKPLHQIIKFAIPMMVGNLVQQLYNIVDAIVIGQVVGRDGLAAVSSSFTIMVFITSIIIGLTLGVGIVFSHYFGAKDWSNLKKSIGMGSFLIGGLTVLLQILSSSSVNWMIKSMQVPESIVSLTCEYLSIIFAGIIFVFIYNFMACTLRAIGDSKTPLYFLIVSAFLNIGLDLLFTVGFHMGVRGVALATVLAQGIAGTGCLIYGIKKLTYLEWNRKDFKWERSIFYRLIKYGILTAIQQSIMNFGILMVQGLVNSFGVVAMAAFGAVNKIDAFAYMPVQDFGNAFATYVAQNKGANQEKRIEEGMRCTVKMIIIFCGMISTLVLLNSEFLLGLFIKSDELQVLKTGLTYLRMVAPCYVLIGFLFMYYGYYRGLGYAWMTIILTIISLGSRVFLAYGLARLTTFGLLGIWAAIPIGWALADGVGCLVWYTKIRRCQ